MASNFKLADLSDEVGRTAYADAIVSQIESIELRTGAPPTNTTDADSGTLLATFTGVTFNAAVEGTATAQTIASVVGLAAGDAGHYRAKDSGGVVVMQGTAGETADTVRKDGFYI